MDNLKNNSNNYTIAVIDDEEQIRDILYKKLSNLGYNVIPLEEAEDLINLLKHDDKNLDLVITDIQLKRMDGIELLRHINAREIPIPVLLITGYGNIEDAIQALRYGARDFIRKPFDLNDIASSVKGILRGRREEELTDNLGQYITKEKRLFEIPVDSTISNVVSYILTKDLTSIGLCDRSSTENILLALREAIDNAMIHGNLEINSEIIERNGIKEFHELVEKRKKDAGYRDRKVTIYYELVDDYVEYIIEDEGQGFNYNSLPDPRDPENFYKKSGRGLLIIRTLMDEVNWNSKGNIIRLRKYKTDKDGKIHQPEQVLSDTKSKDYASSH